MHAEAPSVEPERNRAGISLPEPERSPAGTGPLDQPASSRASSLSEGRRPTSPPQQLDRPNLLGNTSVKDPLETSTADIKGHVQLQEGQDADGNSKERRQLQQMPESRVRPSEEVAGHILSPARSPASVTARNASDASKSRTDDATSDSAKPTPRKQTDGQLVRNSANFNPLL